ncbi:MAG: class I SAM-dependent methyltransferase [bacterium]
MKHKDRYLAANRANWDERVGIHAGTRSELYDIEAFLAGESTLQEIELAELGDVSGRRLLHLMCHFGLDTLSWARRGAEVTGVDFSPQAIATARDLAQRAGLTAEFVCADVYSLPEVLTRRFDLVIASYGVLAWLPDLDRFLQVVSHFLSPGGLLLLVDVHPFVDMFEYSDKRDDLEIRYSYFHADEPDTVECETSYVNPDQALRNTTTYQWWHDLASIVKAVVGNGMELVSLREYAYLFYERFPHLQKIDSNKWILPADRPQIPLTFSLKARQTACAHDKETL